jgi:hypothetical protein
MIARRSRSQTGARRADVAGFGVPEHHGFGLARARSKRQSQRRNLVIGGLSVNLAEMAPIPATFWINDTAAATK